MTIPELPWPPAVRRLRISVSIVAMVLVLQLVPPLLLRREPQRLGGFIFFAVELPIVLFALSAAFRFTTKRRFGPITTLATSLGVASLLGSMLALLSWVVMSQFTTPDRQATFSRVATFGFFVGLVQCGIWALAFLYPFALEEQRLRVVEGERLRLEAEALKLEADRLRQASELARLRAQLEPHFLLNTLNAIAGLVTQRPDESRRLLVCLGDLLRDSLEDADELQSLDAEIAWLRRYADILESRHSGTIGFHWEVDDAARSVMLPRLILQPLVENAVKHGALQRAAGKGEVRVSASLKDTKKLTCVIEDNGPGVAEDVPARSGALGLRAVRRRLELKWPGATLRLESSAEGTRSIVELPL